ARRPYRSQGDSSLESRLALRLRLAGISYRNDPHRGAGARHSRIRRNQQRDGADKNRRHPDLRFCRRGFRESRPLASLHATGMVGGADRGSIIFFTYIGFDSVSTAAEEATNPQKDIPIGILATLFVCTVLYLAVAVTLSGLVPWQSVLDDAAPVVNA